MTIPLSTLMKSFDFKNDITKDELLHIFLTYDWENVEYSLNKLEDLGFIVVQKKGDLYNITNHIDVEQNIVKYIKAHIDDFTFEEWKTFLELEWSDQTKEVFAKFFNQKYPDDHYKMSVFSEPYPLRPTSLNPLEANDVFTSNLHVNIYDCLFSYDIDGNFSTNLVQHYIMDEHVLKIYLKKGVKFHNGSELCAEDVVKNLTDLFNSSRYQFFAKNIVAIEALSNYTLQIIMEKCSPMIFNILSTNHSSIYKFENGHYIGTGPFYLGHDYISHREMYAFEHYHQGRPNIDKILNIQVPIDFYRDEKYQTFIENSTMTTVNNAYSLMMLIFNFEQKNVSNPKVRDYITTIIRHHISHLLSTNNHVSPNYTGFFKDSKVHEHGIPEKNLFPNHEIRVAIVSNIMDEGETIAALLESYGFNVHRVYYQFSDFVKTDITSVEADVMLGTYGLYNQPDYSFYIFLTAVITSLVGNNSNITQLIKEFEFTATEDNHAINLKIENILISQNIVVPILKNYRLVTIPNNIVHYKIRATGFVDYKSIVMD